MPLRHIPLSANRALIHPTLAMRPGHVPGQLPIWEATGQEVRFRLGRVENIRQTSIDQPAFEALPDDIKALTRQAMLEQSQEQKLVGMDKPLKLTDRQLRMFSSLARMMSERLPPFNPKGVEGGQRLPSGVWGSTTDTLDIWRAMAKRGVLEIVQGNEQASFHQYRVNPGPRFEEAVELFLTSDIYPPRQCGLPLGHGSLSAWPGTTEHPAQALAPVTVLGNLRWGQTFWPSPAVGGSLGRHLRKQPTAAYMVAVFLGEKA